MKISEALRMTDRLALSFPLREFPIESQRAYAEALLDLDFETVSRAIAEIISTEERLPSIAKIRRLSGALSRPETGAGWAEAWGEVKAAIGRYGRNRSPVLRDPLAAHVVGLLGWRELCNSDLSSEPTLRAQFRDMYNQIAEKHNRTGALPAPRENLAALDAPADARSLVAGLSKQLNAAREESD